MFNKKDYHKQYYQKNRDKLLLSRKQYLKEYYQKNKRKIIKNSKRNKKIYIKDVNNVKKIKETARTYNKKTRLNHKLFCLSYLRNKCYNCEYNKCISSLECHHLNPNYKKYNISQMCGMPIDIIQKELDKCIILCSNCHAIEESKLKKTKGYSDKSALIRNRLNNIKKKLINLKGDKCNKCNITFNEVLRMFEFHHRDPSQKLFNISDKNLQKGWKIVVKESEKCDLLCGNCHHETHYCGNNYEGFN